jgi:hypothetical protein
MHKGRRKRIIRGTGRVGKVAVMGLLDRHGKDGHSVMRLSLLPNIKRHAVHALVNANVEAGSAVYTDSYLSFRGLDANYIHGIIDHAEKYVEGAVHTNGCENFWSLLKRAIKGTYVSVEPFHLFRYLDEQAFRFNNRKLSDAARFAITASSIFGKRLTFNALTAADVRP